MAATEVNLLFTGRGARETFDRQRTYTRMFEVLTDDPLDDEQVVGNAAGIPQLGTEFEADPDAVVVNVDCRQSDESPTIWMVTIEYDSNPPTPDKDKPDQKVDLDGDTIDKTERPTNPLTEPAVWTLTFEDSEEPATEGIEVKYDGTLKTLVPAAWAANTRYGLGAKVSKGGKVYVMTGVDGVSGSTGPSGTGSSIVDSPAAWAGTASSNRQSPRRAAR